MCAVSRQLGPLQGKYSCHEHILLMLGDRSGVYCIVEFDPGRQQVTPTLRIFFPIDNLMLRALSREAMPYPEYDT